MVKFRLEIRVWAEESGLGDQGCGVKILGSWHLGSGSGSRVRGLVQDSKP